MSTAQQAVAFAPRDFQQPLDVVVNWPPSDDRNAARVGRDAVVLITQLEFIARTYFNIVFPETSAPGSLSPAESSEKQSEFDKYMLEVLRHMRELHLKLKDGLEVRRVQRDVERFTPHLKQRLERAIADADEQLIELRSIVAFLVREDDDLELGVELVPPAGEPMEPEDSLPAGL